MSYPAMWTDVVDLRDFYESGSGQMARRLIRNKLRSLWSDTSGQRVLGLGFATPYLQQFQHEAERVIAIMPASQGVLAWPPEGPNLTALAYETELPLPDRSIDRILLVHAVESTEQTRAMLREIWRVMTDGGRLIVIVPNRRSIWAGLERTPFGNGRPYTHTQLNRLLRENMFTPLHKTEALIMPPTNSRPLLRLAPTFERASRLLQTFAGVNIVEASKQIYAATGVRDARPARGYLVLPQGLPQ
jgi:SAM-dependent methyltransferase